MSINGLMSKLAGDPAEESWAAERCRRRGARETAEEMRCKVTGDGLICFGEVR